MPDPLRLRIQQAISEFLKEITLANAYEHDLGPDFDWPEGKVFRGRLIFGESDPLPMVSILEVPIPQDQLLPPRDSTQTTGVWDLVVQGFVEDDPINPTDPAHRLMGDVKKRLAWEKQRASRPGGYPFGNKFVTNMEIGPGVVRPPDETSAKAYFWLGLGIRLAEDLLDPFG